MKDCVERMVWKCTLKLMLLLPQNMWVYMFVATLSCTKPHKSLANRKFIMIMFTVQYRMSFMFPMPWVMKTSLLKMLLMTFSLEWKKTNMLCHRWRDIFDISKHTGEWWLMCCHKYNRFLYFNCRMYIHWLKGRQSFSLKNPFTGNQEKRLMTYTNNCPIKNTEKSQESK